MRYKLKLPLARIVRFCGRTKPSYSRNEVLFLAISYFYWKRLFVDTTFKAINLNGDPLADLVFVDYFEFHSFKDLWRLIYPLLEPIFEDADFNQKFEMDQLKGFKTQEVRSESIKTTTAVDYNCKKSPNKSLLQFKRRRLDDNSFNNSLLKNELYSDCSSSSDDSSNTLVIDSAASSILQHNLFENQQAPTSQHESLLVEPDKPFWYYINPRLDDTSFRGDEDDTSDTETLVYDDVASSVCNLQSDQSSDLNIENIVNLDELNSFKNRISFVLANSRMLNELKPAENDHMFINEDIDYDSDLEETWTCDSCLTKTKNNITVGSCMSCWQLRPSLQATKFPITRFHRPNALAISQPKTLTHKPYYWLVEKHIGNVFIWDILGTKPPPDFKRQNSLVVESEKNIRVGERSMPPMFIVPQRDHRRIKNEGSALPDIDELKSGDRVTISYSVKVGICQLCLKNPTDSILVHANGVGHPFSCYDCSQILFRSEMNCPICRKTITFVCQTDNFKSVPALVI